MSTRTTTVSIKVFAIGAVTTLAFVGAPSAFAAPTDPIVVQQVAAGDLIAATSVTVPLASVTSDHSATFATADLNLHVDDATGSGDGWTVSQQISDFAYSGDSSTQGNIPAANFSITTIGDAIDATTTTADASLAKGTAGSLADGRTVFIATAEEGVGEYNSAIGVRLDIPADSRAGTYSATLTTTVTSGPPAL